MYKNVCVVLFSLLVAGTSLAQAPEFRPEPKGEPKQRTPEMIARKQTEMLVRELNITDSIQKVQLYEHHLKYARHINDSITRREDLARLQAMTQELQEILTEEQFNQFMNKQVDCSSHRHRPMIGPMRSACDKYAHRPSERQPQVEPQGRP